MNMNYKDFPVACMHEFESVVVDVINYDDTYVVQLNFFKQFADEGDQRGEGFVLATEICGDTLLEVYQKVNALIEIGLFDGTQVSGHGHVYDEDHNEIGQVCWHQFNEADYEENEDITDQMIHPAPRVLH